MTHSSIKLSDEQKIDFFLPYLSDYKHEMAKMLSELRKEDCSDSQWQLIINIKKSGLFLKHHSLGEVWESFQLFLKKESPFYGFIEAQTKGLVEKSFIFWIFSSPTLAGDYFKHQLKIPKGFNQKSIITLPFPSLFPLFTTSAQKRITNSAVGTPTRIQDTLELLILADEFLQPDEMKKLDRFVIKKGWGTIIKEVKQLKEDHQNPASKEKSQKRRSQNLLLFIRKHLVIKDAMDKKYLKKLLADQPDDRLKGLKLLTKKLQDLKETLS